MTLGALGQKSSGRSLDDFQDVSSLKLRVLTRCSGDRVAVLQVLVLYKRFQPQNLLHKYIVLHCVYNCLYMH